MKMKATRTSLNKNDVMYVIVSYLHLPKTLSPIHPLISITGWKLHVVYVNSWLFQKKKEIMKERILSFNKAPSTTSPLTFYYKERKYNNIVGEIKKYM